MQVHNTSITVVQGSVVDQDVDCIVNAANTSMRGGGGVDGAIHRAAGKGLMAELIQTARHGSKTGVPVLTHGHNLKQPWIIHVAGPVYSNKNAEQAHALLHDAYANSLELAEKRGFGSIAFCSISTGVYGFPIEPAASIALQAAVSHCEKHPDSSIKKIVFAMFQATEFTAFQAALDGLSAESEAVLLSRC